MLNVNSPCRTAKISRSKLGDDLGERSRFRDDLGFLSALGTLVTYVNYNFLTLPAKWTLFPPILH